MEGDSKRRARNMLLGQDYRIVAYSLDKSEEDYFIRLEDRKLKILNTRTGKTIFDGQIDKGRDFLDRLFIIYKLSNELHIVGIYVDLRKDLNLKHDSEWEDPVGFNHHLLLTKHKDRYPSYSEIFLCTPEGYERVAQYRAMGNLLTVDFMKDYWETDQYENITYEPEFFIRKVIRILDKKVLYTSSTCRYSGDSILKNVVDLPPTAYFKDGLVLFNQGALRKQRVWGGYKNHIVIDDEITVYNLDGTVRYKGNSSAIVGIERLYHMSITSGVTESNQLDIITSDRKGKATGKIKID
jgi:hypothetical protein